MDSVTVLQNFKKKIFYFFPEINDTTKEKFIYQMAYRFTLRKYGRFGGIKNFLCNFIRNGAKKLQVPVSV